MNSDRKFEASGISVLVASYATNGLHKLLALINHVVTGLFVPSMIDG
jgi:hypothetical protein